MSQTIPIDEEAVAQAKPAEDLPTLLSLDDVEFVASTYLSLLRRPADPDGLVHYTRKLRAGHTKLEILQLVLSSCEGRAKRAQLPGLSRALRRHRFSRMPLLGWLVRRIGNLEGFSARDRCLRAIEQAQHRQERAASVQHAQMLQAIQSIAQFAAGAGAGYGPGHLPADELIVQRKGQTPSVLSRFIKLDRNAADEVLAQLAEIVQGSLEAEQLAARPTSPRPEARS